MASRRTTRKAFILKLRRMKPAVRQEIELATSRNAADVAKLAKRLAPIGKYAGAGDLKASTKAIGESDGAAIRWKVVSGDEKAFYARMVEFGTAPATRGATVTNASGRKRKAGRTHPGTRARPYFFPAYRALRKRLRTRLSRAFTKAKKRALE